MEKERLTRGLSDNANNRKLHYPTLTIFLPISSEFLFSEMNKIIECSIKYFLIDDFELNMHSAKK